MKATAKLVDSQDATVIDLEASLGAAMFDIEHLSTMMSVISRLASDEDIKAMADYAMRMLNQVHNDIDVFQSHIVYEEGPGHGKL